MATAAANLYQHRAVSAPLYVELKPEKAQKSSGFRARNTYEVGIKDRVLIDPCCGSGGMFVQSADFVKRHQGNINDISVYDQESNPPTWKMTTMNLAIRGIDADLGDHNADTFFEDLHKTEKFDFILANPPFNLKDWGGKKLEDDVRWQYGTTPEGNANFAWVQHMIHHLNRLGRMGMVLANGALSSQTNNEGEIRAKIVDADLVEGIIAMPDKLFYSTGIPVGLWIITRNKKQSGKTLFIDACDMGTMVSRRLREFTDADIAKVSTAFDAFRDGTLETEKDFSAIGHDGGYQGAGLHPDSRPLRRCRRNGGRR